MLFGIVPLLVVLIGFRDRPSRYGLTLGDWRWGLGLMLAGCVVMTPIVLAFATLPDVRAYYAPSAGPIGDVLITNALELTATEFAFRGFLMLTLVRVIGPLGVVVAALPFVFGSSRQAGARALLDARRRPGLRLARLADTVDRLGRDRPHVHPDPRDGRGRRLRRGQPFAARATSESSSTSMP